MVYGLNSIFFCNFFKLLNLKFNLSRIWSGYDYRLFIGYLMYNSLGSMVLLFSSNILLVHLYFLLESKSLFLLNLFLVRFREFSILCISKMFIFGRFFLYLTFLGLESKCFQVNFLFFKFKAGFYLNDELLIYGLFYICQSLGYFIWEAFVDGAVVKVFGSMKSLYFSLVFLKSNLLLLGNTLTDIIVSDFPEKYERFQIAYYVLSLTLGIRFVFIVYTSEYRGVLSIVNIFAASNWLEREIWDMFGIYFIEHPDLRRILTDYGFSGFPLRKDFPVVGFIEVFFDDSKNRICYVPVSFAQEFRVFNFDNPWERSRYLN